MGLLENQRVGDSIGVRDAKPVSEIQRQRAEMLAAYESPANLTVPAFAKLAGKSRDQINRDLKAKRLLAIDIGNRGRRIPEWQLDPMCHELVLAVLRHNPDADSWAVYRALTMADVDTGGVGSIAFVTPDNFEHVLSATTKRL